MQRLGAFSQQVLAAVRTLNGEGYGVTIHNLIVERTAREVAIGAVYATLERLEQKGLISSRIGEATAERGGRAKRHVAITKDGIATLEAAWTESDRMRNIS